MKDRVMVLIAVTLFLVLSLNVALRSKHPMASFGGWATDHPSHTGSMILFAYSGFDIFSRPIRELCNRFPNDQWWEKKYHAYPDQMCSPPDRGYSNRPLLINWPQYPRFYPIGANLFAALEAVLYETTSISFHTLNKVTIIKYIAAAIAGILLFWGVLREFIRKEPWTIIFLILVASKLLFWSMSGFFDVVAVGLIFAAVLLLRKGQNAEAITVYALALIFHYRAIWFFPLPVFAALRLLRKNDARRLIRYPMIAYLLLAGVFGGLSLYTFFLSSSYLSTMHQNNPLSFTHSHFPVLSVILLVSGLASVVAALSRSWIVLAVLLSQLLVMGFTIEIKPWHSIFSLGLLVVGFLAEKPYVRVTLLVVFLVQDVIIFHTWFFSEPWPYYAFHGLF